VHECPNLTARLEKWRARGSLQYLAHHLGVTLKQVTRYWDNGWIAGGYLTPRGHRRVRYTEDTVRHVRLLAKLSTETNKTIRYRMRPIFHRGAEVDMAGCTNRRALYERLCRNGLSADEAQRVVDGVADRVADQVQVPEVERCQLSTVRAWMAALERISAEELAQYDKLFGMIPVEVLVEARDPAEFRAAARQAWEEIAECLAYTATLAKLARERVRPLLVGPMDLAEFQEAFERAHEEAYHPDVHEPAKLSMLFAQAEAGLSNEARPEFQRKVCERWGLNETVLKTAVLTLRQRVEKPTVTALAAVLGVSRRRLYHAFGAKAIREELRVLWNARSERTPNIQHRTSNIQ
jgi:hypothetical protein